MSTTTDTAAILAKLQQAYDLVKADNPRSLSFDDRLIDDLELDSLDLIAAEISTRQVVDEMERTREQ